MENLRHIKTIHSTTDIREYYFEGEDIIVEKVLKPNSSSEYKHKILKFIKNNPSHSILPLLDGLYWKGS